MTEQPDTAEIRNTHRTGGPRDWEVTALALCTALDAARDKIRIITEWLDRANDLGNRMTIGLGTAAEQRDEALARCERLEAAMLALLVRNKEGIELCEEMIPYVPQYFRDKWALDDQLAKLKGAGG